MHELTSRLAGLSPADRARLERLLFADRAQEVPEGRVVAPSPERPPLSFAQHRLWFLDQMAPGDPGYNLAGGWRIRGQLDERAMAAAYLAVLDRHEALRTNFPSQDGEPWQRVGARDQELAIEVASGLEEFERAKAAVARFRFDLENGPLVHARLLRLGPDEHYLLMVVHHIVADAWSVSIILRDLLEAYEAIAAGRAYQPVPLTTSYCDFASAQRSEAGSAAAASDMAYWREALRGVPVADLPTDHPRPTFPNSRGRRVTFRIDAPMVARITELAAASSATQFAVLTSAFSVLLCGYCGQHDIAIGAPVSGRDAPGTKNLVGLFVNTVVLRSDVSDNPSFCQLIRRATAQVLAAYQHQGVPFEALVTELAPVRDPSRNPLFQVMLTLENTPPPPDRTAELHLESDRLDSAAAKFDLHLVVSPINGVLLCDLLYAASLFDEARIIQLAYGFLALLEAALAEPDLPVSRLPLTDARERARIDQWNDNRVWYQPLPLPRLVAAQAARTPDRAAVGIAGRWLDYATFLAQVNRLARRLREYGAGRDAVVGVHLRRGIDMVIAVHAVLASSAAYLPLEPEHPAARLRFMVRDAGASLVISSADLADRLGDLGQVTAIHLDAQADAQETAPDGEIEPPGGDIPMDCLAYVIYTSGSTGRPKGVGVSHRAIANRLRWMQDTFPLGPSDRVLHKTPFGFDVSVWELFWPLIAGAALSVAAPGGHRDPGYLATTIESDEISTVHFVPSLLDVFLDEPDLARRLPCLRRVICSGEELRPALVSRFASVLPHTELHNLYGPTETAVDVSWQPCGTLAPGDPVPIGKPVSNTGLEVLDRNLRRVPIGVLGELGVTGVQLARGYLGRPGVTAERFVANPFGPPGSRLYLTGDLVVRREDGAIEFRGRGDEQVKIRGLRVELGEVEAGLAELPGVRCAAAAVRDDGSGPRLVGYLCLANGAALPDWQRLLAGTLPAHLIPAACVVLGALPVTANGKLDRAALPAPPRQAATSASSAELSGPAEEAVSAAWLEVLDLDRVDARDDFFAIGGDSIRSLKVVASLRQAGYAVRLQDLFAHPTLRDLASAIDGAEPMPESPPRPGTSPFSLVNPADLAVMKARAGRRRKDRT